MQTFTPMQYLQIDIANHFGLDKKTWNERINWVADFEEELESKAKEAEEPAQYLAAVMAYRAAQRGEAIGHLCSLDATASGIQLLSLLSGCKTSGQTCNLVNTERREDAYTLGYERMNRLLGTAGKLPRSVIKGALMPHFYGSKANPRDTFGDGTPELEAFYQMIDQLFPGANQLNHDLVDLWRSDVLSHDWILPDGYEVKVKVMATVERQFTFFGQPYTINEKVNQPMESGLSNAANIVHSIDALVVREMNRRCNYDVSQVYMVNEVLSRSFKGMSTSRQKDLDLLRILELYNNSGFMSAVVFEYLDAGNCGHLDNLQGMAVLDLIYSLPNKPFKLLANHDCFRAHANYMNDVRQQYVNILAELADSNILQSIVSQVAGEEVQVSRLGNLAEHIRNSEYALS